MSKLKSITRKVLMALSGFFLLVFLTQHLLINLLSVISPTAFNEVSHFMGHNPLVQFALQPVLMFGFMFHIVMGIVLELQNRAARPTKYYGGNKASASFVSKNMIYTGAFVLLFLVGHLYGFWWHEIKVKYIEGQFGVPTDRYYDELVAAFQNPGIVFFYIAAFIALGLHLAHGFQSAFQSVGANHSKYTAIIKKVGMVYAYVVPAGFAFVALYHFLIN